MISERSDDESQILNLRRNLLTKDYSEIPSIQIFSKMNFIPVQPPKRNQIEQEVPKKSEVSKIVTGSEYEKPVKRKLRDIYNGYLKKFEDICKEVIDSKFLKIFEEIYKFMFFMKFCEEPHLRTIILNTDQNASEFFNSLDDFISSKYQDNTGNNRRIKYIDDSHFKDMKGLFNEMRIAPDGEGFEDVNTEKIVRLVVIREIQKIDKLNFNIFIGRVLEYHQESLRIFTNILVFDVSYDPRGLFEKIKPNHLCKMSFHNVENIPSRNIYQEVLYKFIHSKNYQSFFIPHAVNLKKIVDYVNNHQISVKSFKHYFKFLLIHFFLLDGWKADEYLMYHLKLQNYSDDTSLAEFFGKELKYIYGSESRMYKKEDIDYLIKRYKENKRNVDLFFKFYKIFEHFALDMKYGSKISPEVKYKFFFEFLQFGEESERMNKNRVEVLRSYIAGKKDFDYYNWIKDKVIPELLKALDNLEEIEEDSDSQITVDNLGNIHAMINNLNKSYSNKMKRMKKEGGMDPEELPGSQISEHYLERLLNWLKNDFLNLACFSFINININRKSSITKDNRIVINTGKHYLNFVEIVNPSFSSIVMDILGNFTDTIIKAKKNNRNKKVLCEDIQQEASLHLISSENFEENYTLGMLFKQFIVLFGHAPTEFRLKFLFIEFLRQYSVDFENNNEWAESLRINFLYFCHVFYLLGYISRKSPKSDVFIKNYFDLPSYYLLGQK